ACRSACEGLGVDLGGTCTAYVTANPPPPEAFFAFEGGPLDFCAATAAPTELACDEGCGRDDDSGAGFRWCEDMCARVVATATAGCPTDPPAAADLCAAIRGELTAACVDRFGYCAETPAGCATTAGCDDGDACVDDVCEIRARQRTLVGGAAAGVDQSTPTAVTLEVLQGGVIEDLDVGLRLVGPANRSRDVQVAVEHGGTTVVLHAAVASPVATPIPGENGFIVYGQIDALFDDEAPDAVPAAPEPRTEDVVVDVFGVVRPEGGALSAFDGMDLAGTWTLTLVDPGPSPGDGDALEGWFMLATLEVGDCTHAPASCDDGTPCTDDACEPGIGCVNTPNTAPCDDGSTCTTGDTCADGACVGAAVAVDDGNPCTDDACDAVDGVSHVPNTAPCDDGNTCTTGDVCGGGVCLPGAAVAIDDGNPCTDDACDPVLGVSHTNNTAPCSDGDVCNGEEVCAGGACQAGTPLARDDGNPCTDDACDPVSGVYHTVN
ncbi:MAG: hypothetical protein KC635_15455, partial [Myxococcales bacterium]|nr:hypothetical protein [Myxococcales bacterium]